LSPNRKAGQVYIYAEGDGLKDRDQQLIERAASDPLLDVSP